MNSLYQVLHCHTTLSDGTLSHKEVLNMCEKWGIGIVAFTDHDILLPENTLKELKSLNHKVKFISGIEFSANTTPEVDGDISSFHIIGLFVDHHNKPLLDYCEKAKKNRRARITTIVNNLKKEGFLITEEEVEKESFEGTMGRPHIVRALLSHKENLNVIKKTLEHFRIKAQEDSTLRARYEEVKSNNVWQQVFDLYLGNNPFVSNVYESYVGKVSLDFGVKLIREAGGIAVLAHPSYYRDKLGVEIVEKLAKEGRIDGIETVFGLSPSGPTDFGEDIPSFKRIINKYNLVGGGGGDFHTPEDFRRIEVESNKPPMEETKLFMDKILAKWPKYREQIY